MYLPCGGMRPIDLGEKCQASRQSSDDHLSDLRSVEVVGADVVDDVGTGCVA